jgi:TolA-binding protein
VTLFKLERYEEAVAAFETLLSSFPASEYAAMAAYNVTLALANLEDWPAYVQACERIVSDFPGHERRPEMLLQSAVVYQDEMGEYAKAAAAYEAALQTNAASAPEILYRMGECRSKLNDLDGALAAFAKAGASGPDDDQFRIAALAEAAEIHEKRADWVSALEAYRAIARSGANPEWVAMAEAKIAAVEARTP